MVSIVIGNLEFDEVNKSLFTEWSYGGRKFVLQGTIGKKIPSDPEFRKIHFTLDAEIDEDEEDILDFSKFNRYSKLCSRAIFLSH